MRITNNMMADVTLRNLNQISDHLDQLQSQLTSGNRISKPSDDPLGAATAIELGGTIDGIQQYIRNADVAKSWLDASDAALAAVEDALQRARELAVQGSNDTYSTSDRANMATEVSVLLDRAISEGNSTFAGQYLFAGFKVGTAPFALSGDGKSTSFSGDSGQIKRQIGDQSLVTVNVSGDSALGPVYSALISVRDALQNGDGQAIAATITSADNALSSLLATRAAVGARLNRIAAQEDGMQSLQTNLSGLLSQTKDVDMTQAITDFTLQQNVYKAALAAGAQAIKPSLLDYWGR